MRKLLTGNLLAWIPLIVLLVLALYLGRDLLPGQSAAADTALDETPMVGQKMPALNLPALDEKDTPLVAADLAGKPKLLNFFASWCGPCKEENSQLLELQKQGAVIDGVALQDSPPALWSYLGARGNAYEKIGMDNTGSTAIEWGVRGIPETFVISGKGEIIAHHIGPLSPGDAAALMKKLKEAAG